MGKTGVLGSFEELVLVALVRQADEAYGVSIRRELEGRTGASVAMGAVYATLDRLEARGLVSVRAGDTNEARRGRPRRYYDLTPRGLAELQRTRAVRATLWDGVDLDRVAVSRGGGE